MPRLRARRIEPRQHDTTTAAGRAAALFELFGLKGATFELWTPARGWRAARSKKGHSYPLSERTLRDALAGKLAVAPRSRTAAQVVFDFDAGHDVDLSGRAVAREQKKGPIAATLDASIEGNTKAIARRRLIAKANAETVRAVVGAFPEARVVTTPNGLRAVVLMDGRYDVAELHAAGARVIAALSLHRVEVFPKPDGSLGRLALTGPSRLVNGELTRFVNKHKADDELAILRAPRLTLEAFLGRLSTPSSTVAAQPVTLPIELRATGGAPIKILEGNSSDRVEDREHLPSSIVFGHAFVRQARRYLTGGIGKAESWDATIKIADVMSNMLWIDEADAVARFRRLRRVPGHTARHCQTARLWREREEQFLARFRNNRASGKAHDVSTRSLRVAVDELADGDAVRTGLSVEQAIEIARARDALRLEGCARGGRVRAGLEARKAQAAPLTLEDVACELAATVADNIATARGRRGELADSAGSNAPAVVAPPVALPHDALGCSR